MIEIEKKHQ